MILKSGVQLYSQAIDLSSRIKISSGTRWCDEVAYGDDCYRGYVPLDDWREPHKKEINALLTSTLPINNYEYIGISSISKDLLSMSKKLSFIENKTVYDIEKNENLYNEFVRSILNFFSGQVIEKENIEILGSFVNSICGLKSTAYNPKESVYLGLHIDCWDKLPWDQRNTARNRILINLGDEERYFLFVNLTASQILKHIKMISNGAPPYPYHNFFELFPNYPVVKIKLFPGEYYIAPTENIMHDGSTEEKIHLDIVFAMLGQFKII